MANNAFDREVINLRERPVSSDINTAQSQLDRTLRDVLATFFKSKQTGNDLPNNPQSGFLGDSLKVRPPAAPGLAVQIAPGIGFLYSPADLPSSIGGVVGLDDLSNYKPLPLLATMNLVGIPAGPVAGTSRYDIIEVRVNRALGNSLSRDTLDPTSGLFVPGLVDKTLGFLLDGGQGSVNDPASSTAAVSYKVGIAGVSPVEPSVTPGYVKIATIYSNNGNMTAGITSANIIDRRFPLEAYGMCPFSVAASIPSGAAAPPTGVVLNGPPGLTAIVTKIAAPAQYRFTVYLIGGEMSGARGSMQGRAFHAYSASEVYLLNYAGTTFGTLNSGQVTQLADATLSAPAQSLPVGTPYMATEFYATRQTGGTTDTNVSDPVVVDIQGVLQRY